MNAYISFRWKNDDGMILYKLSALAHISPLTVKYRKVSNIRRTK